MEGFVGKERKGMCSLRQLRMLAVRIPELILETEINKDKGHHEVSLTEVMLVIRVVMREGKGNTGSNYLTLFGGEEVWGSGLFDLLMEDRRLNEVKS